MHRSVFLFLCFSAEGGRQELCLCIAVCLPLVNVQFRCSSNARSSSQTQTHQLLEIYASWCILSLSFSAESGWQDLRCCSAVCLTLLYKIKMWLQCTIIKANTDSAVARDLCIVVYACFVLFSRGWATGIMSLHCCFLASCQCAIQM